MHIENAIKRTQKKEVKRGRTNEDAKRGRTNKDAKRGHTLRTHY